MKRLIICILLFAFAAISWAVPKPMESITNYNVLLLHGAYGHYKKDKNGKVDKSKPQGFLESETIPSANDADDYLGNATIGRYTGNSRINYWLSKEIFEEPEWIDDKEGVHNSYIYHWRAFSNPPNSSITNAIELGDRTWNKDKKFGKRRALVEEAQEVKACFVVDPNDTSRDLHGQVALDSMRRHPDLYRQLASRYILIGHSMGGVVAREYTQNSDYYHQDVDKIITLDSPHEGTGALEMQLNLVKHGFNISESVSSTAVAWGLFALNTRYSFMSKAVGLVAAIWATVHGLSNSIAPFIIEKNLQDYTDDDPLVKYVNPSDKPEKGNISYLKEIAVSENQPMFRLMGGEKSITYSDPYKYVTTPLGFLIPEGMIHAVVNFISELDQSDDFTSLEAFTLASKAATMGFAASAAVHEQGTSIVPKASSWADSTISLNGDKADVKRYRFDAAPIDDEEGWRWVSTITSSAVVLCLAVDVSLSWFEGARMAANIALGVGSVAAATNIAVSLASEDLFTEIEKSHNLPVDDVYENQNTWHADYSNTISPIASSSVNDTAINPRIMEDFLYERPFVNLALNDLHTLDSLQKNSDESDDFRGLVTLLKNASSAKKASVRDSVLNAASSLKTYRQQIKEMLSDSCMNINSCLDSRLSSFVSVRVASLNRNCYYIGSRDSVNCATGLFAKQDSLNSTLWMQGVSVLTPLKFHSESDWSKMGVKVDRWEKVPGLKPNGTPDDTIVPIRHVERYEVPAIVVEDFIEKYSFVVDDLMPHRLRQIRMNFNFQEEIAWECDISKDPQADDACKVYKRTGGGNWINPIVVVDSADVNGVRTEIRRDTIDKVPHPVLKNGQFDFNPNDYGYYNKLALQKDNQNTVTVSMVNKIGLSNTQRFYYLFKATDNMLQPSWPKRDVVLNKIKGFKAYASALAYQGYTAAGADDIILPQFASDSASPYTRQGMDMFIDWKIDMSRIGQVNVDSTGKAYDKSSAYFASKQENSDPQEGDYLWKFFVDINNIANPDNKDTSNTYEVPFRVDRTAPVFTLRAENDFVNPSNDPFVARFTWGDSASTPDIRAMRLTLEQMDLNSAGHPFTQVAEFSAMSDVASPDFAIQWNDTTRRMIEKKGDGFYRIKAYAVDYAVPDSAVFNKMDSLVTAIMMHPNRVKPSLWPTAADSVNSTTVYDTFFVDTKAPVMSDETLKGFSTGSSEYSKLSHPARKSGYAYATEDSLLEISYKEA